MERQTVVKTPKPAARSNHLQRQSPGSAHTAHPLAGLQTSIGNLALRRLIDSHYIQAKLEISTPGDPFEKEADRVADTVMRMPEPNANGQGETAVPTEKLVTPGITPLRRLPTSSAEEEKEPEEQPSEEVQRAPIEVSEEDRKGTVAAKADSAPSLQRQASPEGVAETELQRAPTALEEIGEAEKLSPKLVDDAARSNAAQVQCKLEQPVGDVNEELVAPTPILRAPVAVREDDEEEKIAPKLDDKVTARENETIVESGSKADSPIQRQTRDEEEQTKETQTAAPVQRETQQLETETVYSKSIFTNRAVTSTQSTSTAVQRMCSGCETEEKDEDQPEAVQREPDVSPPIEDRVSPPSDTPIQRQLKDDNEKPDFAEQVATPIQRQLEDEDEELQTKLHSNQESQLPVVSPSPLPAIQRLCTECETERQSPAARPAPAINRAAAGRLPAPNGLGSSLAANVHALNNGGSPLSDSTRAFFEPRFGVDFSQVRIHTDTRAADTARAINAKAFTVGRNIAFGTGHFAPSSQDGRRLLAHELTHTLQQNQGTNHGLASAVTAARSPDGLLVQRDGNTPAPASGVTPPSPPPPSGPSVAPPPKETETGLVYITIDRWELLKKQEKPITPIKPWSTEVPLIKIPIPEIGAAANLSFKASFSTELNVWYGPIVMTNLTLGMTKLTAVMIGGAAALGVAALPVAGPGAIGPLLMALKYGYITGMGQLDAPAGVTAKVKAEAKLEAVLALLGTEKLDLARTGFGLSGELKAFLEGNASGRTQVILDNGHLTWKKGALLSAKGGFEVDINAFLEASILFGLFKARLNKKWPIVDKDWKFAATQPIGDLSLLYDWPSFKDEDHIITLKEETIRGVMNFVKDLLSKDEKPGEVKDKEKLSEHTGPDKRTPGQKQEALDKAILDSDAELNKPDATAACVEGKLAEIKVANRLTSLTLIRAGEDQFFVEGIINPIKASPKRSLKTQPAVCAIGPADPSKDSAAQLALAKATFKREHFIRQQLQDLLKVGETTAKDRIRTWRDSDQLFALESNATDPFKAYNFDRARSGDRPLADTESNRSKYGFRNPAHDSPQGYKILSKGIRPGSRPPSDPKSRYDSMRDGKRAKPPSRFVDFPRPLARLGHGPVGASVFWNEGTPTPGHKQSFEENQKWNKNPDNYWGPEHEDQSTASGSKSPRYLVPMRAIGSHKDWLVV